MQLTARSTVPSSRIVAAAGALPVTAEEFAAAMARLGPFEARPYLAVAVSGGRDSIALTLLAQDWVRQRHGVLQALIVDHRLRTESSEEADQVALLLRARGIPAQVLPWMSSKPKQGVSEAARHARYELLRERCRALGIGHLLLGHQADDQAETVLLRLADGSGPEGLAGIAALVETQDLRLLRPLLEFPRKRLAATVQASGLDWIDDPSNECDDYARVVARKALDRQAREALRDVAAHAAMVRAAIDRRLTMLAGDLVRVDPAGFAWLDRAGFLRLPPAIARRLLGRLAAVFGGLHYPARQAGLARAVEMLRDERSAVAGGCRFIARGVRVLVCREAGAIGAPLPAEPNRPMLWDRRYVVTAPADGSIGKLGAPGRLTALRSGLTCLRDMPAPVAEGLPGLWQGPALRGIFLPKTAKSGAGPDDGRGDPSPATVVACLGAAFQPPQGLTPLGGPLVLPPGEPMYLD